MAKEKEEGAIKINPAEKFILDFNQPMLSLDGTKDNSTMLNQIVAQYLGANQEDDAYKFSNWAMTCYQDGKLVLDKADFRSVKEYLKKIKGGAMIRRQILDVIDEVDK